MVSLGPKKPTLPDTDTVVPGFSAVAIYIWLNQVNSRWPV